MNGKVIILTKIYKCIPVIISALFISLCACADSSGQLETSASPTITPTQNNTPFASQNDTSSPTYQPDDDSDASTPTTLSGEVVVTFDYEKQSGSASNQYAVWVEDMEGNSINTLYATQWTASGGHKSRPDSITLWVEKSSIASMPDYYVDAISGATPKSSGSQLYAWNLKDINGDTVSPGEYKIIVEGTLRWKNYVLHSCVITIGDAPITVQADAEFVYEASDRQAALTSDSPENAMIGAVTITYSPDVNK